MPNHFDSTLQIEGEEADLNKFIQDFRASAVQGRLCICQFADPMPLILYQCYNIGGCLLEEQRHYTGRELTEEEMEQLRNCGYSSLGEFAKKWWGLHYGCYDSSLIRISPNKTIFQFWVPIEEVPERIGQLLHIKYPTLTFTYNGIDECIPEHTFSWKINNTDPVLTREKIDSDFFEKQRQKRLEAVEFLRRAGHFINLKP